MFEPNPIVVAGQLMDGRDLLPPAGSIPAEFDQQNWQTNPWVKFQRDWTGLNTPLPIEGLTVVAPLTAPAVFNHLMALQYSHGLTFEDKIKAVAYLASIWCTKIVLAGVTYENAPA